MSSNRSGQSWRGRRVVARLGMASGGYAEQAGGLRSFETAALVAASRRRLVPLVGQRYALSDAAAAHGALEGRATVGKTVLLP